MTYFFHNNEKVSKSFSCDLQDIFVLTATNGMMNGTFLEIGAHDPISWNNTYLLEENFDWKGISIDCNDWYAKNWLDYRPKSNLKILDALTLDYGNLLPSFFPNTEIIDYLQVDIEPSLNTLAALKRIPFEKYKFRTITFETDLYRDGDQARNESRYFLWNLGYELVAGDVLHNYQFPYEDWWVHPNLVDRNIIDFLKSRSKQNPDPRSFLIN